MADDGLNARDAKLVQYLNEAYGKEKELETSLQAHISMATRPPYKKRLQQHLKETKGHARQLERRIKQLGGKAEAGPAPDAAPDVVAGAATTVSNVAKRGVAAAKGPLHAIRGTGDAEKMLKNVKTEYWNEFEEIATYNSIETLATTVGDRDTAQIAKGIRREEERMAKFLERLIPQLTKAVAQKEIPASERRTSRSSGRRRSSASRSSSRSASSRSSGSRAKSTGRKSSASRSSSSRSGSSRSASSSRSRSSGSRSGSSRRGRSRRS